MSENAPVAVFNRGIIDPRGQARVDVDRVALSAETMTNFVPRVMGSMIFRPGGEYVDSTLNDGESVHIPFVFSADDTAIIEFTDGKMRVRVDEQVITRDSVSTSITNGTFDSNLNNWTDSDESGTTSQHDASGYMDLAGTRFNAAIREQEVTVAPADRNVKHGLKIKIERGPVRFKVGSSSQDDDYISETALDTGEHSLAFTPTGNFHVTFFSRTQYSVLVDSIEVESSGDMSITAPWSVGDLENIRWAQSADVVFIASDGFRQRKVERRGTESWSLVSYETEDGPFRPQNTTTLSMTSGALTGDTTLTASRDYFDEDHVGAIFQLISRGQKTEATITGEGQFTDSIRVTGVGNSRIFDLDLANLTSTSTTATLQRSFDDEASWNDVTTYTTDQNTTVDDGLDNEIVFYRLGVDTGDYSSGTITATLEWSGGGITGTCRVTGYTSTTQVSIAVLNHIGQTTATDQWSEGIYSDFRGWPTEVNLYEGRLWWFGKNWITGSVSDAFESFDESIEGASAPIIKVIGQGPVDFINWSLALQRLLIGTESIEFSARSTSLDELLTTTNFNLKPASTQGSARVAAVKVDSRGIYVQRGGFKPYELSIADFTTLDYTSLDLGVLAPDIGEPGIIKLAVQRQPDTRVHCLRSDGTVAILVYNPIEDVKCWIEYETGDADWNNGVVEDIFVLPGSIEDVVYYVVKREINGSTVRYVEKWAQEIECVGGTYNCNLDSFRMFINNPASATVTGLTHLIGESVVVWADGKCLNDSAGDIATFTVDSNGEITLTHEGSSYSASQGVAGLSLTAQFKSGILPYAASLGTPLTQRQRISSIGLIAEHIHNQGLKFGRDFTNMSQLPKVIDGATVASTDVHTFLELPQVTFPGQTGTGQRLHLEANAPRPVTVMAAVLGISTYERRP